MVAYLSDGHCLRELLSSCRQQQKLQRRVIQLREHPLLIRRSLLVDVEQAPRAMLIVVQLIGSRTTPPGAEFAAVPRSETLIATNAFTHSPETRNDNDVGTDAPTAESLATSSGRSL